MQNLGGNSVPVRMALLPEYSFQRLCLQYFRVRYHFSSHGIFQFLATFSPEDSCRRSASTATAKSDSAKHWNGERRGCERQKNGSRWRASLSGYGLVQKDNSNKFEDLPLIF